MSPTQRAEQIIGGGYQVNSRPNFRSLIDVVANSPNWPDNKWTADVASSGLPETPDGYAVVQAFGICAESDWVYQSG